MKRGVQGLSIAAFVAAGFGAGGWLAVARSPQQEPQQEKSAATLTAEDFLFMSGSWQLDSKDGDRIEEHWTLPAGGSLIGMSRTLKKGKSVFFEFLRLEQSKDGVAYVAQPGGKPAVRFRCTSLTRLTSKKAVFENPEHDFPTTITYEQVSDHELVATVSGPPTAKEKAQEYRYQRAGEEVRLPD